MSTTRTDVDWVAVSAGLIVNRVLLVLINRLRRLGS